MGSVKFSPTNSSVHMTRTASVPGKDAHSWVAWVRISAYTPNRATILGIFDQGGGSSNYISIETDAGESGVLRVARGFNAFDLWDDGYTGWAIIGVSSGFDAGSGPQLFAFYLREGQELEVPVQTDLHPDTFTPDTISVMENVNFTGFNSIAVDFAYLAVFSAAHDPVDLAAAAQVRSTPGLSGLVFFNPMNSAATPHVDGSSLGQNFTLVGTPTAESDQPALFAGGDAGEISGTATATTTATGTLTGEGALAGAATATSSRTGELEGTGELDGTAAASAAASGALTGDGALAGAAAATSSPAGALTGVADLSGTASAAAMATGTLQSENDLSGSASATATATGTLEGVGELAGAATVQTNATGTLEQDDPGRIQGTASATTTATGALSGMGALAGAALALAASVALLVATADLAGAAAASTSPTTALTAIGELSGSISSSTDADGTLSPAGELSGHAHCTAHATLLNGYLFGSASCSVSATGTLSSEFLFSLAPPERRARAPRESRTVKA